MPWLIGIDEAGYGPNLGPFVMSAVACRVPAQLTTADLWHVLQTAVRRAGQAGAGRLLVDDSKVVYATSRGLAALETGVLAALHPECSEETPALRQLLEALCPDSHGELCAEAWYTGTTPLPMESSVDELGAAGGVFREACEEAGVCWGPVRSVVVCPPRFNAVVEREGSKGAVLADCLAELLRCGRCVDGGEPLFFFIDKHGGRNKYAALVQHALPGGVPVTHKEDMARSEYSVAGLERDVRLTFEPRADASYFCVALASMVSKYLRELLMHEFNTFWQAKVPGLKATAGYPGDAARFWQAIRAAAARLGLAEGAVWRRK